MSNSLDLHQWTLTSTWMSRVDCRFWMNEITNKVDWQQPYVSVYGSFHLVPRMNAFLADKHITYRYSGVIHCGNGWPNWFSPLLNSVNSFCEVKFNGCLINLYRNGYDHMGWHSDDEKELDLSKPIASLSFGAARDIAFRHRDYKLRELLLLEEGDLLVMHPGCQENWMHSLPTRRKIKDPRINLTFRCYK